MKVKRKSPTYEVFHLESREQLTELRDWLDERGWLMDIQEWEELGFFRPKSRLNTNFFDVFFYIGKYILVETTDNEWGFPHIQTVLSLNKFEIVED